MAVLICGSSWLLAPTLNTNLAVNTTMISQYKMPGQPFFWLFAVGDILAGLLIIYAAHGSKRPLRWLKLFGYVIGSLIIIDSLAPVNCTMQGTHCVEQVSITFVIHAIESVSLGLLVFGLSVWHGLIRKSLMSLAFALFQIAYGVLWLVTLGGQNNLGTLTQYIYQLLVLIWLAWWIGDWAAPRPTGIKLEQATTFRMVRVSIAAWAYLNGTLAILLGILHVKVWGFISNLYFFNGTAWLAQYSVVAGLAMLYLSRHLARGEYRARQLFLVLLFMELTKYSVVLPQPLLLAIYGLSFVVLFSLGSFYRRGSQPLIWQVRLQEASIVISGAALALAGVALLYFTDHRFAATVRRSFHGFYGYVVTNDRIPKHTLRSALLAHTFAALISGLLMLLLWSLFRPARLYLRRTNTAQEQLEARELLLAASNSSEDYFKLCPADKSYFWNQKRNGFIAYKIAGPGVFALADPVAKNSRTKQALVTDFSEYWQAHGRTCCFLVVASASLPLYTKAGFKSVHIGSNAVVDVEQFADVTVRNKWWRWQTNRGSKLGYNYHVAEPPHSVDFMVQLKRVSDLWLSRKGHREQGFALGYFNAVYLDQCRVHYLLNEADEVVAFANELPVFNSVPQATVDLIRFDPHATNSMPFLLARMIQKLAEEGSYETFDLGFVPFAATKGPVLSIAKTLSAGRFSAKGLEQFKNKFDPEWQPNYLAYDGDLADLALLALQLENAMKLD
jgi:phosphatidylglycerol lysyltransferase